MVACNLQGVDRVDEDGHPCCQSRPTGGISIALACMFACMHLLFLMTQCVQHLLECPSDCCIWLGVAPCQNGTPNRWCQAETSESAGTVRIEIPCPLLIVNVQLNVSIDAVEGPSLLSMVVNPMACSVFIHIGLHTCISACDTAVVAFPQHPASAWACL